MKSIFLSTISHGGFDLPTMLRRIDEYHIAGKLTDAEREELQAAARGGASPAMDAAGEIQRLWADFRALEARVVALEGGTTGNGAQSPDAWPVWRQPAGAHDAYFAGDGMTYTDGLRYTCIAPEGVACVWSPETMPGYWRAS